MGSEIYHRTFLPDGPFESFAKAHGVKEKQVKWPNFGPDKPSEWQTISKGQQSPGRPGQPLSPGHKPLTPFSPTAPAPAVAPAMSPKLYARTQARFRVLQVTPTDEINEIWVVEKTDQNFRLTATPWERIHSPFANIQARTFIPFVDDSLTVVGYFGTVYDHHIYVLQRPLRVNTYLELPHDWEMVASFSPPSYEQLAPSNGGDNTLYSVIVDIDGRIASSEVIDHSGIISVDNPDPRFFFGLLKGLITKVVLKYSTVAGKGLLKIIKRRREFNASSSGGRPPGGKPPGGVPLGSGAGAKIKPTRTLGGTNVFGKPGAVGDAARREEFAVKRYELSGGSKDIYYDDAARPVFGVGKAEKYPDVTVKYKSGAVAISDGKGNHADKAIKQFEAAEQFHKGQVKYQEIIVSHTRPLQHPDGGMIQTVGPNLATGKEYGWKLMDVSSWPPKIVKTSNGVDIRVIVVDQADSNFPLPPSL